MDRKHGSAIVRALGIASGAGLVFGVTVGSRVARAVATGAGVVGMADLLTRWARRAFIRQVFWAEMRENELRARQAMQASAAAG